MAESIRLTGWAIIGGKGIAAFSDDLGLEVESLADLKFHDHRRPSPSGRPPTH